MRIAFVGTRGLPPRYGGFETAAEEIGRRLVTYGHEVVVYCRGAEAPMRSYLGMELVHLPTVRLKATETLVHSAVSVGHLSISRCDVAVVFNAANAPLLPLLRAQGIPVALHVDGLESRRSKWGRTGRRYYEAAEAMAARWADVLIADAHGIQDYYRARHGVPSVYLAYGGSVVHAPADDRLAELGIQPRRYHLVVARFEPENHVLEVIEGFLRSQTEHPLVVVGSAPYSAGYVAGIEACAAAENRVRLVGAVWDQELLDQLYANALTYQHGHSVGGTNPSLLRAMGAGTAVCAYDVVFNREVLGTTGRFWADADGAATAMEDAEADPSAAGARGMAGQERVSRLYRWDDVARGYETLCLDLAARRAPVGVGAPGGGARVPHPA